MSLLNKLGWLIGGLLLTILLPTLSVAYADFGLTVTPVIPDNQQDNSVQSYNLLMAKDEERSYQLAVQNLTDSEKAIDISVIDSSTMSAGQIDLTNKEPRLINDGSKKLTDITEVSQSELILPAKSSKQVTFKIKVPKEGIEGILLGSIYLLDQNKTEEKSPQKEGVAIHNQMGYPIEVLLASSNKQNKATLLLESVKATTYGGQPALEIPLANTQGHIIPDLAVTTVVRKSNESQPLVEDEKVENKVAPKSIFPHQVILSSEKVVPGHYLANITARSEFGKWEWEKPFEITAQAANDINQQTTISDDHQWWYYVGAIGLLLLSLIGYLVNKNRQLKAKNRP